MEVAPAQGAVGIYDQKRLQIAGLSSPHRIKLFLPGLLLRRSDLCKIGRRGDEENRHEYGETAAGLAILGTQFERTS
jgi:hypothetical protein